MRGVDFTAGLPLHDRFPSFKTLVLQVEKAPVVVKAGLKKDEAEELVKKLEAGALWNRACLAACAIHQA